MFGQDELHEIRRITPFNLTLSTNGFDLRINMEGGFMEGVNAFGDIKIESLENSKLPIVKEFVSFYKRMKKKYSKEEKK